MDDMETRLRNYSPKKMLTYAINEHGANKRSPHEEYIILERVKYYIQQIKEKKGDINDLTTVFVGFNIKRTFARTAVLANTPETLKLLLDAKANPDYDPPGCTLFSVPYLFTAVEHKSTECVDILLKKYHEIGILNTLLNQQEASESKKTCLIVAAKNGDSQTLRLLLDAKANPNTKDAFEKSSLFYATFNYFIRRNPNDLICINKLLEAKATSITPTINPSDYKTANKKTSKFIFSKLKESAPQMNKSDTEQLHKSLSFTEIRESIQPKNLDFNFDLIRIIYEYLDNDVKLKDLEIVIVNEQDPLIKSLKRPEIVSCVLGFLMGIFLYKYVNNTYSNYDCLKLGLVSGLGLFGITAGLDVKFSLSEYKKQESKYP